MEHQLCIGLDLGGTKCLGVALRGNEVVAERREETPEGSEDAIVDLLEQVASELIDDAGRPTAIGVGAPGLVTLDGVFLFGPNVPELTTVDLRSILTKRLGVSVEVENDAAAAAWGEFEMGAARDVSSAVVVTLGTGVGGGLIANDELIRGAHGFAAELGHLAVSTEADCVCGKRGCWETLASGTALGEQARQAVASATKSESADLLARAGGKVADIDGEQVTAAAKAGDLLALDVLDQFAEHVALGLGHLVEVLDPELIVVGGGLVEAGDVLLDPVRRKIANHVYAAELRDLPPVVGAELGERAGAIGAALLGASRAGARTSSARP